MSCGDPFMKFGCCSEHDCVTVMIDVIFLFVSCPGGGPSFELLLGYTPFPVEAVKSD